MRTAVLGTILFMVACESGKLPPEADADLARRSLETALQAWVRGDSPESLRKQEPPIYLNDSRFTGGAKLVSFSIHENTSRTGRSVRLTATLGLLNKDGVKKDKQTGFTVDTAPVIVIVGE